ncbi:ferrous iron transport protein B [Clostridium botulinum]|uniref:Ferrous iron transport protein B n=1 Tax=Clostridium botulinum (strain Langeland / NCTC 10281 / Type F) TaxID=441772 RepID=A7GC73_CLOBL|nr:ferrous iron transport protein B [Clostridium botulinum]ABS42762.1 ferrous iron transport protein B [Clostridium botulinum F str. Langeland]ADF98848.1 ferrous iron transport protein B [Clostridium botulinum F str. 230613]KKM39876.1 iron transporter FeoB [Clostridium botulinum]MBY6792112.1 ferrous iron transport protein B [Clostridium botulinum]MBY6936121.1 ferrous iron transport protein B [Clostridium botulinum]
MENIRIALVGNPNCGKTTMFNYLTGSSQYVGNWPGVTVEKKEGKLKQHKDVKVIDLPGIYSLSPYTLEEVITRNYLITEKPEVIINIVDGTNLERNLYLSTQVMELGIPVIIALNMMDIVRKNGDIIDKDKLSKSMGCTVVETSALKGEGCKELIDKAIELAKSHKNNIIEHAFSNDVEKVLSDIENEIYNQVQKEHLRWFAIKLFENDEKAIEQGNISKASKDKVKAIVSSCEDELDDDGESIITNERYNYISKIISKCVVKKNKSKLTTSDKIDKIVTNRVLGLPIFAAVMFLVYYLSISTIGTGATDWVNDVLFGDIIPPAVEGFLTSIGTAAWLNSLILDGIIAGVGAVLGFLPQMMVLFLCLAILEDCGYMSRIAFIMDRIFRKFGLSGKSFIPMLIGTGCGVPGIMASRTIENESDRKMTIITTTFMPCSAKLPIIALIAGALFPGAAWVAPSAYFLGIGAIICSGIILKKTKAFAGEPAPFVMELPKYHVPGIKGVLIHMWDRAKSFVKKAGTIIFLACGLIWFLGSFNWSLAMVETPDSMLASMGKAIAPIFNPLGWGDWKAAVATISGLIAKENVVGTFGILYGAGEVAEDGVEIWKTLHGSFTQLSAYSFLIFNLLCAPCFAAIGAIKREMGNKKWTWIAVGYQTGLAYGVALTFYQLGLLFTGKGFGIGTLVALVLLAWFLYMLFRPQKDFSNSTNIKGDRTENISA